MMRKFSVSEPCCEKLRNAIADPDVPIVYSAKFREYGISVLDGGTSYIVIQYCPWCGEEFPSSLRDKWIARIEKLGLEPGDARIPDEFLDDRWYREAKIRRTPDGVGAIRKAKSKRARCR
jgi:hypothetical protein